jgi:hypothetical protein
MWSLFWRLCDKTQRRNNMQSGGSFKLTHRWCARKFLSASLLYMWEGWAPDSPRTILGIKPSIARNQGCQPSTSSKLADPDVRLSRFSSPTYKKNDGTVCRWSCVYKAKCFMTKKLVAVLNTTWKPANLSHPSKKAAGLHHKSANMDIHVCTLDFWKNNQNPDKVKGNLLTTQPASSIAGKKGKVLEILKSVALASREPPPRQPLPWNQQEAALTVVSGESLLLLRIKREHRERRRSLGIRRLHQKYPHQETRLN